MNTITSLLKSFWKEDEGLTVVEYAIAAGVIAAGVIAAGVIAIFTAIGSKASSKLDVLNSALGS
ncbi:hypothetical protein JCM19379_29210 [Methyloparacoccus murrellii]